MIYAVLMLSAWGLCFGFQHKIPMLHGKSDFIDSMLACTFCTGFHAGYMVWMLWMGSQLDIAASGVFEVSIVSIMASLFKMACEGAIYALASASFCYMSDTWSRYLESNSDPIEVEEEEQ